MKQMFCSGVGWVLDGEATAVVTAKVGRSCVDRVVMEVELGLDVLGVVLMGGDVLVAGVVGGLKCGSWDK